MKNGFTLVEVVVVTALILLVSLVGIQTADIVAQREKEERLRYSLLEMRAAMDLYFQDKTEFPEKLVDLTTTQRLVNGSNYGYYLRRIPLNPFLRNREWEVYSQTTASGAGEISTKTNPLDGSHSLIGRIVDVRYPDPLAEALDGTKYSKW